MEQPIYTACVNCGSVNHFEYVCPCGCHAPLSIPEDDLPRCAVCDRPFDHGCNTGVCSEECERAADDSDMDDRDRCTDPRGHDFQCTGTAYGGVDPRWFGEGRCLCVHCGADGDA